MRAMFGLVSLLVMIAIIMLIFRQIEYPTIKQGENAQDQARQLSGRGQDGQAAITSFKTEGKFRGSNLEALVVTSVTPGGAMDDYGLKKGDQIIEVNGSKVGDIAVNDPETAKAMVVQNGFQAMAPIVVLRNGQQVTLQQNAGAPHGAAQPQENPIQRQLDAIKNP